jgi:FlaA1/EpsC-like NDP-sugar epimerase
MKKPPYSSTFSVVMSSIDLMVLIVTFKLSVSAFPGLVPDSETNRIIFLMNSVLSWMFFSQTCRINLPPNNRRIAIMLKNVSSAYILFTLYIVLVTVILLPGTVAVEFALLFTLLFFLSIAVLRSVLLKLYGHYRGLKGNRKNYIIIGFNQRGIRLSNYFKKRPELGYNFVGYLDDHEEHPLVLGKVADFLRIFDLKNIDEIYFALPGTHPSLAEITETCDNHYIRLHLITNVTGLESEKIDFNVIEDIRMPLLSSLGVPAGCFLNYRLRRAGAKAIWRINALLRNNHQPSV